MINLKLKTEFILLSILIIGLIFILASFLKQLSFADNSREVQKGKRIEIRVNDTLEQKFITEDNGLSNLKILFGNRALRQYNYLKFTLADKNCSKSIAEEILKGAYDLDSKYLYDFNFSKIENSKNKKYCLKINLTVEKKWSLLRKIEGKLRPEKYDGRQKIRFFESADENINKNNRTVSKKKIYSYRIKNKSNKKMIQGNASIVFRQSFKNKTKIQDFQQLNERISQYKPWFLKSAYLLLVVMLSIILTIASVLIILKHKK